MTNPERIRKLEELIDKILDSYRYEIYEKKIFQGHDFDRQGKNTLDAAFKVIEKAKSYDLSIFPDGYLDLISEPIKEYERLFKIAVSIDETQEGDGPLIERNRVVENIDRQYSKMFEAMRLVPIFKHTEEAFKKITDKGDKTIKDIKAALIELGINPEADYYENTAKKHAKNAWFWFGGLAGIFITLVLFVYFAFPCDYKEGQLIPWIYSGISRFLIIGLGIYALKFCSRNFDNEKHNEIANKQKYDSLLTFLAIFKAIDDNEDVRDQVLHYAFARIFSKNTTGFSKIKETAPISLTEIFKLIKQIFKK